MIAVPSIQPFSGLSSTKTPKHNDTIADAIKIMIVKSLSAWTNSAKNVVIGFSGNIFVPNRSQNSRYFDQIQHTKAKNTPHGYFSPTPTSAGASNYHIFQDTHLS